jgi:hypothetical protein
MLYLKLYLEWFVQTRTGLLEEDVIDVTVHNHLAYLKRTVHLYTQQYNLL